MNEREEAVRLARLLDENETGEAEEGFSPLLEAAAALRELPRPAVGAEFRREARRRILQQAGSRPRSQNERLAVLRLQLTRLLAATAVFAALLAGVALASAATQSALPGDLIYPIKLSLEDVQLVGADPSEQVLLEMRFTSNRLTEIQILIVQERYADVPAAVAGFRANVARTYDALAQLARSGAAATYPFLVRVETDLDESAAVLEQLMAFVPGETQRVLALAVEASRTD